MPFQPLMPMDKEGAKSGREKEETKKGANKHPFSYYFIFLKHIAQRNHQIAVFVIYMIGIVY